MALLAAALPYYTPIILNTPSDWDMWFDAIETKARGEQIWIYIDSDADTTPILNKPTIPIPSDPPVPQDQVAMMQYKEDRAEYLHAGEVSQRDGDSYQAHDILSLHYGILHST